MKHGKHSPFLTLSRRRWLYGICAAAAPIAVMTGYLTDQLAAAVLVLAAAVLGVSSTALANPTEE